MSSLPVINSARRTKICEEKIPREKCFLGLNAATPAGQHREKGSPRQLLSEPNSPASLFGLKRGICANHSRSSCKERTAFTPIMELSFFITHSNVLARSLGKMLPFGLDGNGCMERSVYCSCNRGCTFRSWYCVKAASSCNCHVASSRNMRSAQNGLVCHKYSPSGCLTGNPPLKAARPQTKPR